MALFFSEQEIDGFRDCFYLNCKSGVISEVDQLKLVMRSVGFSPMQEELEGYLKPRNYSIKFADFLDCAHEHSQKEKVPDEILKAFKVSPLVKEHPKISIDSLRQLLCGWGERLSHKEFNVLIKEMNLNKPEISYTQFVNGLVIPRLDN